MPRQLMRKWHEALEAAEDLIADLASRNVSQRLAQLLLRLARQSRFFRIDAAAVHALANGQP